MICNTFHNNKKTKKIGLLRFLDFLKNFKKLFRTNFSALG